MRLLVPKTREGPAGTAGRMEESNSGWSRGGPGGPGPLYAIDSFSRLLLVTVSEPLQESLNLKHGYGH